ncbi:complex I subunit 5 family protein [Salinirubellus sp. GCM10025818]|uniref:complex I subunit 5 family protein n=1 Tax=Salinirubellus TaxID=2162630 RepID=UPI0030D45D1F
MTEQVVVAPLLAALVTAVLALALRSYPRLQRGVSVIGGGAYGLAVLWLASRVAADADGRLVYQVSDWTAPFGISLVADPLSILMLGLTAVVSLAALVYSLSFMDREVARLSYHPLYHFMIVGVTGSFLTGDVFNLFVWFEVMLMSSYVLVVFYSGPEQTRAALLYSLLNLVGSAVMLLAIGGLYATTGTLNMADMTRRLADPAAYGIDPAPVLGISAVLLSVFALKAGIVPFQFWVPAAYRAAPAPVTAVLAGVVKKVGIYAVIRLYFMVFAATSIPVSLPGVGGESFLAFFGPVLFVTAAASILLGGIGAVGQEGMDGLLAYSSIGQIGFVVLPLAVAATAPEFRVLGVTAALVYAVNHGLAKSLLFLVSGAIRSGTGTDRFADLGGLAGREPILAGSFFVGGLALVGIPPLVGFFGKLLVFDVAGRAGSALGLAVALVGAVFTIAYVTRAWNRGFWGEVGPAVVVSTRQPVLVGVTAALAGVVVLLGVGFDPLFAAAENAAEAALDAQGYVDAVDPATAAEATGDGAGALNGGVSP